MANSWLRLYHDMPNDPKFKTIARVSKQPIAVVLGVYVHLLVSASAAVDRGTLDGYNVEDLATALDVDSASVGAILDAMQGRVLEGDKVSGWDKRQVNREDSSTERMRQFRKKKVTQCDAPVTQCDAVLRNVTADKSREEEIRLETTKTTTTAVAVELPEWVAVESWEAYLEMRRKKRAVPTERAIRGILTQLGKFRNKGHDPNEILDTSTRSNWTDVYEPKGGSSGQANRNHGKTAGNIDSLAAAERFAREQYSQDIGDPGGEASGANITRHVSDILEGSVELLPPRH